MMLILTASLVIDLELRIHLASQFLQESLVILAHGASLAAAENCSETTSSSLAFFFLSVCPCSSLTATL